MGLDIQAYEVVELVHACAVNEHEHEEDGVVYLYSTHWTERADGLVDGAYRVSGERHGFRAGSYGGYNIWREQLAALIGTTPEAIWADPKPGPFYELIHFADNEGIIGGTTSAKLATDFAEWEDRATEYAAKLSAKEPSEGAWFLESYRDWRKAFRIAAGRGAVRFS